MADKRVVRFKQAFYDNEFGLFNKGETYEIPDGVVLPTRDIVYIKGEPIHPQEKPKKGVEVETGELEEDEKPQKKKAPGMAAARKPGSKPKPQPQ